MRSCNNAFGAARAPRSPFRRPPYGFTLVELLVVIAIIGALVALLVPAAMRAVAKAHETRILNEIQQFDAALKDYSNLTSTPPNAQTDSGLAIDNAKVLADFKRHLKKAFPSHREPLALIHGLVGCDADGNPVDGPTAGGVVLAHGMNAAEAFVFWLGGFSDDPKYPISGIGGPSYAVSGSVPANQEDPIDNRPWRLDIAIENLGPRDDAKYFDETDGRYITYQDPQDPNVTRRINFWFLKAPSSAAPYVYFDTSRATSANATNDAPAVTPNFTFTGLNSTVLNDLHNVFAIKQSRSGASTVTQYDFANDGTFQVLHAGIDDAWGVFPVVNSVLVNPLSGDPLDLEFPTGPWTGDLADTLTNFAEGTLEDEQP